MTNIKINKNLFYNDFSVTLNLNEKYFQTLQKNKKAMQLVGFFVLLSLLDLNYKNKEIK